VRILSFPNMCFTPARRRWLLWIAAGVLLRVLFIVFPGSTDDDTAVYLSLGHNLLHHGVYGLGDGDVSAPSLFRLPGYPLFLAILELLFAKTWLYAVFAVQAVADLAGGILLAAFARRHISSRAAEVVLALAMLCPFTAASTAIAMTESLSIFAVSLGIYAAGRALAAAQLGQRDVWALVLSGCAAALAMLLRPDGALCFAALGGGLFFYSACNSAAQPGGRRAVRSAVVSAALFSVVALAPLAPWTARNWLDFHIFEPLAPRHVNDPGERVNLGFYRWVRTWSVEYVSTSDVYWKVGTEKIDIDDLPARAFDSPQQQQQTGALLDEYNRAFDISPELDSRFDALAAERIRSHPLRYYVVVPFLRVADMALRPRTEEFPIDMYWWHWSQHPGETAFAVLLALINLGYLGLAALGFLRGRVPWAGMLGGYIVMRCLLLATMENPEPRYTLEWFPILIVAAGAALTTNRKIGTERLTK
jgi:hypothetical protein